MSRIQETQYAQKQPDFDVAYHNFLAWKDRVRLPHSFPLLTPLSDGDFMRTGSGRFFLGREHDEALETLEAALEHTTTPQIALLIPEGRGVTTLTRYTEFKMREEALAQKTIPVRLTSDDTSSPHASEAYVETQTRLSIMRSWGAQPAEWSEVLGGNLPAEISTTDLMKTLRDHGISLTFLIDNSSFHARNGRYTAYEDSLEVIAQGIFQIQNALEPIQENATPAVREVHFVSPELFDSEYLAEAIVISYPDYSPHQIYQLLEAHYRGINLKLDADILYPYCEKGRRLDEIMDLFEEALQRKVTPWHTAPYFLRADSHDMVNISLGKSETPKDNSEISGRTPLSLTEVELKRITTGRKNTYILQAELAKQLGVDQSVISDYELGKVPMTLRQLARYAHYMGINLDETLENPELITLVKEYIEHNPDYLEFKGMEKRRIDRRLK